MPLLLNDKQPLNYSKLFKQEGVEGLYIGIFGGESPSMSPHHPKNAPQSIRGFKSNGTPGWGPYLLGGLESRSLRELRGEEDVEGRHVEAIHVVRGFKKGWRMLEVEVWEVNLCFRVDLDGSVADSCIICNTF